MRRLSITFLLFFLCFGASGWSQENADSLVFQKFLDYASREKVKQKETGERIISIAGFFLDCPYVAATLEKEGPERLQVNLRELDCTTFVETVLALHQVLKETHPDFETYKRILTSIRYRNGVIDGYPSRLHYMTDWILDNQRKGFVKLVSLGRDAEPFKPALNMMSTHPELYPSLKNNPSYVEEMMRHENRISRETLQYLPKEKLTAQAPFIHSGDIIFISTETPGLDFSHLGFAFRNQGLIYLLHASSSGKKVMISTQSLKDYLLDIRKHKGIVVARPQ